MKKSKYVSHKVHGSDPPLEVRIEEGLRNDSAKTVVILQNGQEVFVLDVQAVFKVAGEGEFLPHLEVRPVTLR